MSSRPPRREPREGTEPGACSFAKVERIDRRVMFGLGTSERGCARSSSACWSGGRVATIAAWVSRSVRRCAVEGPGVVVGGEGLGFSAVQRGGDDFAGGALVGEKPWWVVGVGAGVPGVGGLLPAGLADVAGVPVERGGAEEVDLVPGAALGAVDGTCPGVGDVRCPVGTGPGDRRRGQEDLASRRRAAPSRRWPRRSRACRWCR